MIYKSVGNTFVNHAIKKHHGIETLQVGENIRRSIVKEEFTGISLNFFKSAKKIILLFFMVFILTRIALRNHLEF